MRSGSGCLIILRALSVVSVILILHMRGQIHAYRRLVERTVERRDEEHYDLGSHTYEQHNVRSGQVCQLEQCSENND